jgi:hypothetical protein
MAFLDFCLHQSAYPGWFAAFQRPMSLDWVKTNNIIAFYDTRDINGLSWRQTYANKTISISTSTGIKFNATIVDTCGNHDCNNCCYNGAINYGGYLVDLEYYTALNNFGSTSKMPMSVSFEIMDAPSNNNNNNNNNNNGNTGCNWQGHCLNDPCTTYNDWYLKFYDFSLIIDGLFLIFIYFKLWRLGL